MQVRHYCSAKPWVECTARRYSCTKLPGVHLCPAAYAEGLFPAGCSSKDWVLVDSAHSKPDLVRSDTNDLS